MNAGVEFSIKRRYPGRPGGTEHGTVYSTSSRNDDGSIALAEWASDHDIATFVAGEREYGSDMCSSLPSSPFMLLSSEGTSARVKSHFDPNANVILRSQMA